MKRALLLSLALVTPLLAHAQSPSSEDAAVVAAVQQLFDAMATRDGAGARATLLPDARMISLREEGGRTVRRDLVVQDWLDSITGAKETLLERMWDPHVHVRGAIATLWAPYDFHRGGVFSHCGIDAVDLIKQDNGWKIAGILWTVERTECAPSPLGAPKPQPRP